MAGQSVDSSRVMANPYIQYPRQPQRREVRIEVIGEAWKILTANIVPFVVVGIIALAAFSGYIAVMYNAALADMARHPTKFSLNLLGSDSFSRLVAFLYSIFTYLMIAGTAKMGLVAARGERPSLTDFTSIFSKLPRLLASSIIVSILTVIGCCFCCLPGFLSFGLTMFASLYILDQNLGVFPALSKSFEVLKPCMWLAALLFFFAIVVSGAGIIACGLGYALTFSILPISIGIAFRDMNEVLPGGEMSVDQPEGIPPTIVPE